MIRKKSLLIIGDSFADPFDTDGIDTWYSRTKNSFQVDNRSQAGVGQYKIRQQIKSNDRFDMCIVIVTSEYRIHCLQNPFYVDKSHKHHCSDLIYHDVESRLPDQRAQHIIWWFSEIFDQTHAKYQHNLILRDIEMTLQEHCDRIIPITFFKPYDGMYDFSKQLVDLSFVHKSFPGTINHLTTKGHSVVWQHLEQHLV